MTKKRRGSSLPSYKDWLMVIPGSELPVSVVPQFSDAVGQQQMVSKTYIYVHCAQLFYCLKHFIIFFMRHDFLKYAVDLFEYDRRFEAFENSYYFYDYNFPEALPEHCTNAYSVIILDPPFLSKDCLEKMSQTVKKLAAPDAKILLCTGELLNT